MLGVVEGDAVEQQEVLLRSAAAHIDAAEAFGAALHARHELDGLEHVVLTEEHRSVFYHLHRQFDGAHFGTGDAGVFTGHHRRLLERRSGGQMDVDGGVALEVQFQRLLGVANVREGEIVLALRKRQRVEAVSVGNGALAALDNARAD